MRHKHEKWYISGLPIDTKIKTTLTIILLLAMYLNHIYPTLSFGMDYALKDTISLVLLGLAVIVSLGSYTSETIIIALAIFCVLSGAWDRAVLDLTGLRTNIIIGSILILAIEVTLGRVGLGSLVITLKNALGLRK